MESKYKERANVLLNEYLEKWNKVFDKAIKEKEPNCFYDDWIIDAMCKLAEEVEEITLFNKFGVKVYTKEQVEELLQKQRELCAEKVVTKIIKMQKTGTNAIGGYYSEIDRDSILNAKLKID
jgi:5'(3')-deoxyribonucleotidase